MAVKTNSKIVPPKPPVGAADNALGGLNDPTSWSAPTRLFSVGDPGVVPTTLYWPWVMATDRLANPLDRFYLYYTTDHDAGAGGVYMATGPTEEGPWTHRGLVFVDLAAGSTQTETASVIYDDVAGVVRMYYQQGAAKFGAGNVTSAVGQQSTLSCTSTDGLTFTKDPSFINDIPALADIHGDGHTGYFLPFRTPKGWFAYSLHGGTTGADCVLWKAYRDKSRWMTNRIPLGYGAEFPTGQTYEKIEWNHCSVVASRGVEYLVGIISNGAAGGLAKDSRIFVAPISADYRFILEPAKIIWTPTQSWETSDLRSACPLVSNGKLYVYYTSTKNHVGVISHVL